MSEKKRTTIREVAARAEVSISTVSRYLADPSSVQPFLAYRIKDAVKELEYVPNTFARNLRRGTSTSIGVVVPNLEFFFGKSCRAISDYFYNQNYVTLICETDNEAQKEQFFIQQLIEQQVAGIIVATCGYNTMFLQQVHQKYKNLVMLDRGENIGCDVVTENHEENAFRLTQFVLTNNPCDSLELLLGQEVGVNTKLCLNGVERALAEAGDRPAPKVYTHYGCRREDLLTAAVKRVQQRLDKGRPTFLGFEPDFVEQAVINMNRLDLGMLDKVDIAGCAMRNTMDKLGMKFPCVVRNPELVGIKAAEVLYKRITGTKQEAPQRYEVSSIWNLEG